LAYLSSASIYITVKAYHVMDSNFKIQSIVIKFNLLKLSELVSIYNIDPIYLNEVTQNLLDFYKAFEIKYPKVRNIHKLSINKTK